MDAMTPPDMLQAQGQPAQNAITPEMLAAIPPDVKPASHDVTIVTTKKFAQAKVLGVPPEEFGIERSARDIKTCNYCFHEVVTKTESQLIAEGYDEEQIKSLGDYTGNTDVETIARDSVQEHMGQSGVNSAARLVKVTEHYVRMDYEGKGRACLYLVITGGDQGEILIRDGKEVIEPIDVIPFATTTPVPVTHRFFGRSIADLVVDIQKIKTALMRGMLDNLYLHSNPRVEVPERAAGQNTLDDLLVSRPGGIVRTKEAGMLQWQVVPNIADSIYPALGYLDSTREMRTGVSKQSQGVDANALQNQTAEAVATVFSASQARMKLIARIMAEGVRDIFALLHHTIRSHGQEKQTVRLRNTWVPVDPRNWKTRDDMTINVGLGNGGKAQQFAQAMGLLNIQKELVINGKTNLVDDQALFNSVSDVARIMGHKNADKYINDPSEKNPDGSPKYPPPPPPPSPEEVKGKVQLQIAQQQSELNKQADDRKGQIETVQAQADIATQDRKTQAEMTMAQQQFQFDKDLALMNAALEREKFEREEARKEREHQQKMELAREQHQATMRQGAMGMVATAQQHDTKMEQGEQAHEAKMAAAKAKPKGDK